MDIISDCVFFYLLVSIAFLLYMLRKGVHVLTRCTECQWMIVLSCFFFLNLKIERLHVCIFFFKKSFLLYDKCVQSGTFIQWHVSLSASFLMPVLRMNERYLKLRPFLIRPASPVFTHIKKWYDTLYLYFKKNFPIALPIIPYPCVIILIVERIEYKCVLLLLFGHGIL